MASKQRKSSPSKPRTGRCLCGLRIAIHFTPDNRKLACAEARAAHRRATVRPTRLSDLLRQAVQHA